MQALRGSLCELCVVLAHGKPQARDNRLTNWKTPSFKGAATPGKGAMKTLLHRLALPLILACALGGGPGALAQAVTPNDSSGTITVHLVYQGSYNHTATIHARASFNLTTPSGCFMVQGYPGLVFLVGARTSTESKVFTMMIYEYRSSLSTYGAFVPPHGYARSVAPGGQLHFEAHFLNSAGRFYDTTGGKVAVQIHVTNGGRTGTFAAAHMPHAGNETITGNWSCTQAPMMHPHT